MKDLGDIDRLETIYRIEHDPIDNSWVDEYTRESAPPTDDKDIEWMRSRPASVKALMRLYPPGCVVKGTRKLRIPRPGEYAVVYSYIEDGKIGLARGGENSVNVVGYVRADWIEVVGYRKGMTREWVASILAEGGADDHGKQQEETKDG